MVKNLIACSKCAGLKLPVCGEAKIFFWILCWYDFSFDILQTASQGVIRVNMAEAREEISSEGSCKLPRQIFRG